MKRLALGLLILASFSLSPAVVARPIWSDGPAGLWISTDCATFWENVNGTHAYDCDRFGDKSAMSLDIAEGARPAVRFVDTYATICADAGLATRFVGIGYGEFTDPDDLAQTMFVTLTGTWCGTVPMGERGGIPLSFGQADNPGDDSLWQDSDPNPTPEHEWGYVWYRATLREGR
jgi:hypothetical protein